LSVLLILVGRQMCHRPRWSSPHAPGLVARSASSPRLARRSSRCPRHPEVSGDRGNRGVVVAQRLDRPVHSLGAEFGSPSRRRRGPQSTSHVHSPTQDDSARSVAIWSFICQPKPWSARRSRCSERSASLHWSEPGRSARPRTSRGWASALVVSVGSPRRLGVGDPALQRLGIHPQLLTDPALRSDLAAGRAERRAPS
jgi:hypothetical protein